MSRESSKEFGKIANEYDKGRSSENVKFWTKETRKLAKLTENSYILDLGCGTGLYTAGLQEQTEATICGFDPVPGMLEKARAKYDMIHFFTGVGGHMPLRQGFFDCVFSSQVWHHIEDKQGTANECGRVLKEGGSMVIRTISHEQLHEKVVFKYFPEIKANQLRVYPSNEEFKEYFDNAGFTETVPHAYTMERYQSVEEFVEIAEKKLWSMFRPISEEGFRKGVEDLWRYNEETGGQPVRNDELITLVVSRK